MPKVEPSSSGTLFCVRGCSPTLDAWLGAEVALGSAHGSSADIGVVPKAVFLRAWQIAAFHLSWGKLLLSGTAAIFGCVPCFRTASGSIWTEAVAIP